MAQRPVWWQATDEASTLQLLRDASTATKLEFQPAPAPDSANQQVLRKAAVALAKERVAADHSSQDRVLMEEVKAIDDLLRAANLLVERLREWHGLQDAAAVREAKDAEALVKLIVDAEADAGAGMEEADHVVIVGFADALRAIHASWRAIEARVTDLMGDISPNVNALVGPMVGARLITIAGGLPRLATLPAGTIQTLGAETALFRHIKDGDKPPKHGVLFQHPLVFQAKPWQRGAISRVLANHLALAARADSTTGRDIAAELQESLDADLKKAHARKPKPRGGPGPGGRKGKGGSHHRGPRHKGGGRK